MENKTRYAVLSGFCAASGSLFGKLSGLSVFEGYLVIFRIAFFLLMIVSNGLVWTLFVKALQASKSSLLTTVTSAATNYLASVAFGIVIFHEETSLLWWTGIGLILSGLILILKHDK